MATTVGLMQIRVGAETQTLKKDLAEGSSILASFTGRLKTGAVVSLDFFAGLNMIGSAARSLTGALKGTVQASADLSNAMGLVSVQFEDGAKIVSAAADEQADKFGTVRTEFLRGAADLGILIEKMGKGSEATAEMSVEMTRLAADIASFRGKNFDEVVHKLQAGLRGEVVSLKSLGIVMNDNILKKEAYASGIAKVGKELTFAQKVQARYNVIFDQTTKAHGDMERNAGSLTNSINAVHGRFRNFQASIGAGAEIVGAGFFTVFSDGLKIVSGGLSDTTDGMKQWARESIQTGGIVNETFGFAGEYVALFIDNVTTSVDIMKGMGYTFANLTTGILVGIIDLSNLAEII